MGTTSVTEHLESLQRVAHALGIPQALVAEIADELGLEPAFTLDGKPYFGVDAIAQITNTTRNKRELMNKTIDQSTARKARELAEEIRGHAIAINTTNPQKLIAHYRAAGSRDIIEELGAVFDGLPRKQQGRHGGNRESFAFNALLAASRGRTWLF
ncbi:MAG: hypothetical protein AAFY08_11940 [Planctomycetota bacterium]